MSLSYGMSGTIPYVHNALPRLKTLLPFFGDANLIEPGVYIDEPANYDLTYEKMYELNWNLNFGLLKDRIGVSLSLFSRQGRDLVDISYNQGTGASYKARTATVGLHRKRKGVGALADDAERQDSRTSLGPRPSPTLAIRIR